MATTRSIRERNIIQRAFTLLAATETEAAQLAAHRDATHTEDKRDYWEQYLRAQTDTRDALADLLLEVRALRQLGVVAIDDMPPPALDANPRDTSVEAAFKAAPKAGSLRRKIISEVWLRPSLGGLTCDELERRLNRPHTSVSSAVNSLLRAGWLRDSGLRRPTRNHTPAVVWEVTPLGHDELRRLAAAVEVSA